MIFKSMYVGTKYRLQSTGCDVVWNRNHIKRLHRLENIKFHILREDCDEVISFTAVTFGRLQVVDSELFNPLKPKLVQIIFKDTARTSKRTPYFTITKITC
jgi:hypothetical protein